MNDLLNNLIAPSAGHNQPPDEPIDYAAKTTERLEADYKPLKQTLETLKNEAEAITEVPDDATALRAGGIIKRFRDLRNTLEDKRVVEGEPSLRITNATNAFFNGLKKLIQPQEPKERRITPGYIDLLQGLIDGHQARKEADERERLRLAQAEAKRIADEAARIAAEEARKAAAAQAEADRLAAEAERARKPEIKQEKQEAAQVAAQVASQASAQATHAAVTAEAATETARDARIGTLASAAAVTRVQGTTAEGAGVTLTKATEKYCFMTDRGLIDDASKLVLFNLFTDVEVEKAARSFAVKTSYTQPLPGFDIGTRKKGVTR